MAENSLPRGRGRPRDADKDEAIRKATWTLLATRGYDSLTFEDVAAAAAVSGTTLYRRFGSKAELVARSLHDSSRPTQSGAEQVRDPRATLLAHARNVAAFMRDAPGRAVVTITEAAGREPKLAAALRRLVMNDMATLRRSIEAAHPLPTEENVALAFSLIVGTNMYHSAIMGLPLEDEAIEALVEAALSLR